MDPAGAALEVDTIVVDVDDGAGVGVGVVVGTTVFAVVVSGVV